MGLGKMGEVSDILYHKLSATSDSFIRLETLSEANDRVSNAIAELPIFRYYHMGETPHSSSDGQKFETRIHIINARHSPKYFGLKKGIVSYTLVASHIPVNARIIGANEHESQYVFDLCLTIPPRSSLKFIPPIPTEPTRSILPFFTYSDISSLHAIRIIYTIRSVAHSMDSSTRASMGMYCLSPYGRSNMSFSVGMAEYIRQNGESK